MRSKKSSSNGAFVSMPLMKENLKRFWPGSLLALVLYFGVSCIPIIINRNSVWTVESVLGNNNVAAMAVSLCVPVVAALLIFRYLQSTNSTAVMHSMPFTRKQLFNTGYVSGFILCLVPILITCILLILMSFLIGPIESAEFDVTKGIVTTNAFSVGVILLYTFRIAILTAVTFTLASLSAVICGSSLIQAALSLILAAVGTAVVGLIHFLSSHYLFGYTEPDMLETLGKYVSPLLAYFCDITVVSAVYYIALAVILFFIAQLLYKRRAMEKAGDSLVFGWAGRILRFAAAVLGMVSGALGFYYISDSPSQSLFYIGAIIGAVVSYIVIDMIIYRSVKLKGFVKGFAIVALAGVIIFSGYQMDILGYEKNVPEADSIKYVNLWGLTEADDRIVDTRIKSEYVNKELIALHNDIIAEKDSIRQSIEDTEYTGYYRECYLNIQYYLNNGSTVKRQYNIPVDWIANNEHAKNILECEDYKKTMYPVLTTEDYSDLVSLNLSTSYSGDIFGKHGAMISDEERMAQLMDALKADINDIAAGEMLRSSNKGNRELFTIEVNERKHVEVSEEIKQQYVNFYGTNYEDDSIYNQYSITSSYTRTLELIRSWDLLDSLVVNADDIGGATVTKMSDISTKDEYGTEEIGQAVISDRDQLGIILETAADYSNSKVFYEVDIYKSGTAYDEGNYLSLYFSDDNAPDFIKNLFN